MKNALLSLFLFFCISNTYAQIGINTDGSAPHSSAILDVKSTSKAFYPPRMNTGAKEGIVGVQAGALVYDVNAQDLNFFTGSLWLNVAKLNLPILQFGTTGSSDGLLSLTNNSLSGFSTGIRANIQGDQGFGVVGNAYKTNPMLQSIGVAGFNSSTNANGMGVYGEHAGNGSGVSGKAFGATGIGVKGVSNTGQGGYFSSVSGAGLLAELTDTAPANSSPEKYALGGINQSLNTNGFGIYGAHKGGGDGVFGSAVSGSGVSGIGKYGVTGYTNDATGAGVYGTTSYTSNSVAVKGKSDALGGVGVFGDGLSIGVRGKGGTFGVLGEGVGNPGVKGTSSETAILGESTGNSGSAGYLPIGVRGEALGDYGKGVFGNGKSVGVEGISYDSDGVIGRAKEVNSTHYNAGVYGVNDNNYSSGYGVFGEHKGSGSGVLGYVNSNGIGVRGIISLGGSAGHFSVDENCSNCYGYALTTGIGNVGIGTSAPVAKMDIMGSAYLSHFYYGTNENTYIRGGKAGSHVLINDIAGQGNVGIGVTNPAYILDVKDRIRLRANGSNTAGLYLNNAANTTWTAFAGMKTDTEVGLFIGGSWRFWVDNAGSGFLNGNLIQTSDKRLKQDFSVLTNSLSDIYQLKGYHFKWIEASRSQDLQTGLIAQEVQKIFPELVQTDEKGFLSVNYIGLIPHLIEAVKELRNENKNLKTNNQKLENRLEKIEAILSASNPSTGK